MLLDKYPAQKEIRTSIGTVERKNNFFLPQHEETPEKKKEHQLFKVGLLHTELVHFGWHNLTYTRSIARGLKPIVAQTLTQQHVHMVRIKNTASRVSPSKAMVMKKLQKAASKASSIMKASATSANGLFHTGKLKVPFKPANLKAAKKGLLKQLKRRSELDCSKSGYISLCCIIKQTMLLILLL